ncbi:MAG: hypothetical protein AAGB30_10965 [Pedobacter sp.]
MKEETTAEEALSTIGDVITQKSIRIEISRRPKNLFWKFLMSIGMVGNKHVFELRPIVVGNMYRIASKVIQIPDEYVDVDVMAVAMKSATEHLDKMVYIAACALQNDHREPSKKLLEIVRNGFSSSDLAEMFSHVLVQLNVRDFIKSIVLMKGLNVLNARERDAQTVEAQD